MRLKKSLGIALLAALVLPACEDMFSPTKSRNFDELIPRLMGAVANRTPEDAAANLFNVTSPDERRDAVAYLETKPYGHQPPYMRAYEILAIDPHPMVRAQVMRALGTSYQPEAANYLVKGLNDPEVQVRRDAAQGLCSTWNDSVFTALASHVKDDLDVQVKIFSARALIHATTPEAIRALIDALADMDAAVQRYALGSLRVATREDYSYDQKAWLTWYQNTYAKPASAPAAAP
jgi:HEAT repeat protein